MRNVWGSKIKQWLFGHSVGGQKWESKLKSWGLITRSLEYHTKASLDCFLCKRGFQRLVAREFYDRGHAAGRLFHVWREKAGSRETRLEITAIPQVKASSVSGREWWESKMQYPGREPAEGLASHPCGLANKERERSRGGTSRRTLAKRDIWPAAYFVQPRSSTNFYTFKWMGNWVFCDNAKFRFQRP